jgi:spore germination protein GerM
MPIALPAPSSDTKLYSVPCHKADKEYLLNEALRTGLSQKDLLAKAIDALKKGPRIPNALPIKL